MKTGAARRVNPEPEKPAPESFLEEINRIFNSGTLRGAREIAEQGLALYPDHPELRQVHYALRPFEVRVSKAQASDPTPTFEWLKKNAYAYRGKWVALDKGELVAASENYEEVHQALQGRKPEDTLLHFID